MPQKMKSHDRWELVALIGSLPRGLRLRLTLAVVLIFAVIGPLSRLGETFLDDRFWIHLLITTLFTALIAGNIIWNLHRPRYLLLFLILLLGLFAAWMRETRSSSQDRPESLFSAEMEKQQSRRRSMLVLFGTALMAAGYSMFITLVMREMRRRTRAEAEIRVAREIQTSLLPELHTVQSGLEVHGMMQPAAEVGGDYFDSIRLTPEKTLFVIADVSGHGVGAGILAAMFKSSVWMELRHTEDLASQLRHLNESFYGMIDPRSFITCALLLVDRGGGTVSLATAGHPPILHVAASGGGVRKYETGGFALGLIPQADYTAQSLPYVPGDLFVLYTDGAFEAMDSRGEQLGEERFQRMVAEHAARPPQELCETVLQEIRRFQGNAMPADDITLLAFRCT